MRLCQYARANLKDLVGHVKIGVPRRRASPALCYSVNRTHTLIGIGFAFLVISVNAAADPPSYWMPLQTTGKGWSTGQVQPALDGVVDPLEYANGIKIGINDFSATGFDGELFLALSDNVDFGDQEVCYQLASNLECEGSTLFVGLTQHAQSDELGGESGVAVLYLDVHRQDSIENNPCDPNVIGPAGSANLPGYADRRILLRYNSPQPPFGRTDRVPLSVTPLQFAGDCAGGWNRLFSDDPEAWPVNVVATEHADPKLGSTLTFELNIVAQPQQAPALSSTIVKEKLFGLGILHRSQGDALGQFPSIYNVAPGDTQTTSWATLDLRVPRRLDLSFSAYNIGQLQAPAGDGGQGESEDFAALTYRSDVICLVEAMVADERDAIVNHINQKRQSENLSTVTAVFPENGDAPNNMILSATPTIASTYIKYGDLAQVSAYCGSEPNAIPVSDDECSGIGDPASYPGLKGITWARIATKKSESTADAAGAGPGKTETWYGDHFIDVFCTHTQADYAADGDFAQDQWCDESFGSPAVGKYCEKGPHGPAENPWLANLREEQWDALAKWMDEKRSGGGGLPDGRDRPAILMGDLNQIGPKGVSLTSPNTDVAAWVTSHSQVGFGDEYRAMRLGLGNWSATAFDSANGWAWDLYDLLARDKRGTWIGNGSESGVTDGSAADCITGSQAVGYNVVANLPNEARLDYIMVIPAQTDFPFYAITGPSDSPLEPIVGVSANAGGWHDGLGCASDHAEVTARIGFAESAVSSNFNPNKKHRITYRVSNLVDINDADDGDTDWYVPTDGFLVHAFNATNNPANNSPIETFQKGFPDDQVDDGTHVGVDWHGAVTLLQDQYARARVVIWDSDWPSGDDLYDGTSVGQNSVSPAFEFKHAYPGTFSALQSITSPTPYFLCSAGPTPSDPSGSCANGLVGHVTVGDGDGSDPEDVVRIVQSLYLEEVE